MNCFTCLLLIIPSIASISFAQSTQTIRGTAIDAESQIPLAGVTITVLKDTIPILGTQTAVDGTFRIANVPIGRITLVAEYLGYSTFTASQLIVTAAKEVVLQLHMQPSAESLYPSDEPI